MTGYGSLYDALAHRRDSRHLIGYCRGGGEVKTVTYADLYQRAVGLLGHLQSIGLKKGGRLVVCLPGNEQFIDVFWACVCGGITPVPVSAGISNEHKHKLFRILRQLDQAFLCSDSTTHHRLERFAEEQGLRDDLARIGSRTILIDQVAEGAAGVPDPPDAGDVCLIQYSSGSTSEPKGVVLTHDNVLANIDGVSSGAGFNDEDVSVAWMPLTHDMGLVGHLSYCLNDMDQYVMQTDLFIRRPMRWLQEASRVRATVLTSPNFGYRHFLKVFKPERAGEMDLASVRLIFNGAEPISVVLCEEFLAALAPYGLRRSAMFPVYGLAEATVCATMPPPGTGCRSMRVDRQALGVGDGVRPAAIGSTESLEVVCVGRPVSHCELRVVDGSDRILGHNVAGHIQIRGRNVTQGYFGNPRAGEGAFRADGWLDTGDLGFTAEDGLYVTGRSKELIFVNGQNYYPHDLEGLAQRCSGLELGKVAIAGHRDREAQADEVLIFVLHRGNLEQFLPLATLIARHINEHTGIDVAHVIPVNRIPKTTSGKFQRRHLAQAFEAGEFREVLARLDALSGRDRGPESQPSTEVERHIKTICDTVLPSKDLGIHENIFEIGTSSLELMEIHDQIEEAFPGRIDITELFDYPTISAIAGRLQE